MFLNGQIAPNEQHRYFKRFIRRSNYARGKRLSCQVVIFSAQADYLPNCLHQFNNSKFWQSLGIAWQKQSLSCAFEPALPNFLCQLPLGRLANLVRFIPKLHQPKYSVCQIIVRCGCEQMCRVDLESLPISLVYLVFLNQIINFSKYYQVIYDQKLIKLRSGICHFLVKILLLIQNSPIHYLATC